MREIIFRGKDERTKRWRIGSLLDFDRDSGYLYIVEPYHAASSLPVFELVHDRAHFVIPETVGQYTGLKDRNGVMIFEGDIFRCKDARGYVRFGTYASAYSSGDTHVGFFIEWIVDRMLRIDLAFWTNQREIEVIGNIHDNPELLEV